eukprot:scaffold1182_cov124-Isochrysis_galbana.AAC.9
MSQAAALVATGSARSIRMKRSWSSVSVDGEVHARASLQATSAKPAPGLPSGSKESAAPRRSSGTTPCEISRAASSSEAPSAI